VTRRRGLDNSLDDARLDFAALTELYVIPCKICSRHFLSEITSRDKVQVNLSLCLTKHHAMRN
jgi:hypothetical protein